ncbi:MAG: T9SS type A sorting domain-containing protein [Candidatus Cloacimonetes bacterium]|nr:T9SS type A sorting domain-containing protein [Candidatus Cloacimonadota bacterium]
MKKVFTVALLILVASSLWGMNSFTIEEVTEDFIQVHLRIDEYTIPQSNAKTNETLSLPDLETYFITTEGLPALPFLSGNIGLPPEGKAGVSVLSQEYVTLTNVSIPINHPYKDEGILVPDPSKQFINFKTNNYYPEKAAEVQAMGYIGNRYLGSFRIFPIQYNHTKKTAKLYTDLVIQFHIDGDKSKARGGEVNYIDGIADKMIINNEVSQYWRKEKEKESYLHKRQNETEISQFKFVIEEKGIYKIDYEYLKDTLQTWIDSLGTEYDIRIQIDEINPKYLQLHNQGELIPIYFYGQDDDSFDEGDYFEFYADIYHGENCYYNPFSWENVFFLSYDEEVLGTRLAIEDGGLYETNPYNYRKVYNFDTTVHFENQSIYSKLSQVSPAREDLWFWQQFSAPNMTNFTIQLYNPLQSNARSADVTICYFGETYASENNTGEHHALSYINSSQVGSEYWYGQNEKIMTGTMSNDKLNNGSNQIYLSLPGDTDASYDRVLLDYIDVRYWRECIAHEDLLEFNKPTSFSPGLMQFEINEFTIPDIDVYKIGVSKFENLSIESGLPEGGAPYVLSFQDHVFDNNTKYIAVSDSQKLIPKAVLPDFPSNIRTPNEQADYIVISKREFLEEDIFYDFAAHWYEQKGLIVKTVSTEAIYDEFNYGLKTDKAIKDFISYAYNNWQEPAPQYILLLGDACYDERPTSPNKEYSIVPSHMSWSYKVGATVDDNWFVSIVGDDELPDLAVGRIPVWEAGQILPAFAKTIQYNSQPNFNDNWRNHVMLIAGGSGTFEDQSQRLNRKYIPKTFRVSRIYAQADHDDPYWGSTTNIKDYIDDGTAFMQFMGHGGGQIWSDLNLMNLGDISTLFNDNYPIISSLTCYTSNFEYPGTSCLGEAFVLEAGKGSIGFFGGAGKGFLDQDEYLGAYFLQSMFTFGERNMATVCNIAKTEYALKYPWDSAHLVFLRHFNYMGDPAIDIVFPIQELNTTLDSYQFVKGDTVSIFIENDASTLNRISYYVTDEDDLIRNPYNQSEMIQVELNNIERTSYNPAGYEYIIDTLDTSSEFSRIVRTYGYDSYSDYIGYTEFTVGKAAIFHMHPIPEIPAIGDSIYISAKAYDNAGIDSVKCVWWKYSSPQTQYKVLMEKEVGDTLGYKTIQPIDVFDVETTIEYYIEVYATDGSVTQSEEVNFEVSGPDIAIESFELKYRTTGISFDVELFNIGKLQTPQTKVVLTDGPTILDSITTPQLGSLEKRIITFSCDLTPAEYTLTVHANPDTSYLELSYYNNTSTKIYDINAFTVPNNVALTHTSLDSNFVAAFPSGVVGQDELFYIYPSTLDTITLLPDVEPIPLLSEEYMCYEISPFDSTCLTHDKKFRKDITLAFNYSRTDTTIQHLAQNGNFRIYRWNEELRCWFMIGGDTNLQEKSVSYAYISKPGLYTLFNNDDTTVPSIDVNVEGQEFTNGGYVDNNAQFSFIIQDANGVDVEKIKIFLNGEAVSNYSLSTNNMTSIPVKYQIDVEAGSYTIIISVADVNGNFHERVINFSVQKEFNLIHIGNYPNPVSLETTDPNNEGRTRFTYTLTDDADEVRIEIYTVSGRLVNVIRDMRTTVGYHEYPHTLKGWECVDRDGRKLANGVYFYKIVATKGNESIEKIMKMAILR